MGQWLVLIPGAARAIVEESKVRDYLLSSEHLAGSTKARFFTRLGFEREDWPVLRDELARLAGDDAFLGDRNEFGQKYVVAGTIHGPAGRSAPVVSVWIVLNGEDHPRFVTAYPGATS